jgi:dihydroneopterin aldolase
MHASDTITLTGLTAVGYHGVFDHERRDGQPFVVDVVLSTDIRTAARSDELADTLNYGAVAEDVTALITGTPFRLIESLAEAIAAALLKNYPASAVQVTVHKPKAPITVAFSDVAITIHRSRA